MARRKKINDVNLVVRDHREVEAKIVDLQIQISPRGRSVVNGTVLHDSMLKTIKRDLSADDISAISRLLFGVILHTEL